MTHHERRRHPRLTVASACKIRAQGEVRFTPALARNLSTGGIAVEVRSPTDLRPGARVQIGLPAGDALIRAARLRPARVLRVAPDHDGTQQLALAFDREQASALPLPAAA